MVGKISVGGQGVDVRENRGRDGYRRWERKSSIRVGSGRNRGITQYLAIEKGLKWRKPGEKARELGM